MKLQWNKFSLDLSKKTHIMGVLNVTPDSFSDGGMHFDKSSAVDHALRIIDDGADILDIGGESTRPGSDPVSLDEELRRTIPVIEALAKNISIPISIDTYKSDVAVRALEAGASIVNDISGMRFDPEMPTIISRFKVPVVIMHIKGTPKNMQENPEYKDLVAEVLLYFEKAVWKGNVAGIDQLIIDPGIGFGKTAEHNLKLIRYMYELKKLDCPVMIGVSRKSCIGNITGAEIHERLSGTVALNTVSIMNGVNIIRVHDVKEAVQASKIIDMYKNLK